MENKSLGLSFTAGNEDVYFVWDIIKRLWREVFLYHFVSWPSWVGPMRRVYFSYMTAVLGAL
jgi:hypothetical protein